MEQNLSPGDLCVIVGKPVIDIPAPHAWVIGRTVVLLGIMEGFLYHIALHAPFWRCSGIPPEWAISHELLRKIPPERMLDVRMHDTPVADPEETTV